jgi:hypothetical protein
MACSKNSTEPAKCRLGKTAAYRGVSIIAEQSSDVGDRDADRIDERGNCHVDAIAQQLIRVS